MLKLKNSWKNKNPEFGIKSTLCECFRATFLKTVVIFEISTLGFVKKELLRNAVNFSLGSAFSKGQGFSYSSPDLGPLNKVFLNPHEFFCMIYVSMSANINVIFSFFLSFLFA